ncbi:hypothetical protein DMH25_42690 [Streptomyces sp. WAC 01325]|uniref:hypothetical protein n=1 Tax=Streptomyces sp. WAC 01325 TaxID=2203202 RepID=UPI000F88FA2C|nr:hypothetical protein [Streptomyces sp. WAC 01325]RSM87105.1 hypothetical protein DMH25_42690 [Streptomyces sp. WAC 01325]
MPVHRSDHAVRLPAGSPRLQRALAEYLVLADDEGAYTSNADHFSDDWRPERDVLHVERAAEDSQERRAQRDELSGVCMDSQSPLQLLTYIAVSHGHAAHLAVREFAVATAVAWMADVIDGHQERGERGWAAIRIADGHGDDELHPSKAAARAAQQDPEGHTYVLISPLHPWTPRMCEEHLELAAARRSGRLAHEVGVCD